MKRGGGEGKSICSGTPPMLLVTEGPLADCLPTPAFRRDDIPGICAWLKQELGMEALAHGEEN